MAAGPLAGKPATVAGQKSAWEDGQLRQLLHSPAYNLFPNSAVFESDFVQVTKKGKCMDFSNMPTVVSLGVTSSDPCLPLPNVLLMARHRVLDKGFTAGRNRPPEVPVMELSRLLPLRYVQLSVHHASQRILRLQTVTRKVYYLQLHQDYPQAVFRLWSHLADILKRGLSSTPKDPAIPIQHSLVPSGGSSSSGSSGEPFSDAGPSSGRVSNQQGRKMPSGNSTKDLSGQKFQIRGKEIQPGPKRVSFQQLPAKYRAEAHGDVSAAHRATQCLLLRNMSPLPVCRHCDRLLPQSSEKPHSTRQQVAVGRVQQEEPTSWLKSLSRLWRSTSDIAGRK